MNITETAIPDVKLVRPHLHVDARGWLAQTWTRPELTGAGIPADWAQELQVSSRAAGTLRGLHFQSPPHAQGKFILLLRGSIYDVAVDIRRGSPSFGRHVAVRLDRDTLTQIWIPAGFAHGYLTLEPDTEVLYRVTAPYAPMTEGGLRWNDPALGIAWPEGSYLTVNDRDQRWPLLADLITPFTYGVTP